VGFDERTGCGIGVIERPLRDIKNTIYDRRANLKNGSASGTCSFSPSFTGWGMPTSGQRCFESNTSRTPPRRTVDDTALRPRKSRR
jgi:hypothetical protein